MSNFGSNILKLREKRGLSYRELGELANVSYPNISDYEKGKKIPALGTFVSLAEALGCTLDELYYDKSSTT